MDKSSPDPDLTALVTALMRHGLTLAAGLGLYHGAATDSSLQIGASALVGLAGVIWSLANKFATYRHAHATAVVNNARPEGIGPVQPPRTLLAK